MAHIVVVAMIYIIFVANADLGTGASLILLIIGAGTFLAGVVLGYDVGREEGRKESRKEAPRQQQQRRHDPYEDMLRRAEEQLRRQQEELRRRAPPRQPKPRAAPVAAHWKTLGLKPTATEHDINIAFRTKAQKAHPDHGGTNAKMVALNLARAAALKEIRTRASAKARV